jgi:hypothetical protein
LDFFLWRHLKEHVYAVPPTSIDDLVARLHTAVTIVDAGMLRRVKENTLPSAWKCTALVLNTAASVRGTIS